MLENGRTVQLITVEGKPSRPITPKRAARMVRIGILEWTDASHKSARYTARFLKDTPDLGNDSHEWRKLRSGPAGPMVMQFADMKDRCKVGHSSDPLLADRKGWPEMGIPVQRSPMAEALILKNGKPQS